MSQANVELLRRFLDADRDDLSFALAYLDPEVEWSAHRSATEGIFRGHAGFERFMADTAETFETFEPHWELRDLGERVLAWGTISTQGSGGGVEIDVPVGGIFDLRDGLITRWQDFGSREKALEAVGLSE